MLLATEFTFLSKLSETAANLASKSSDSLLNVDSKFLHQFSIVFLQFYPECVKYAL
jgi:hypothetical protein